MQKSKLKKTLKVCTGTNCTRNHANEIFKRAKKYSDVNLLSSNCMGLCSLAPNVMIDEKIHSNLNPGDIDSLLGKKSKKSFSGPVILDDNGLEDVMDLLNI